MPRQQKLATFQTHERPVSLGILLDRKPTELDRVGACSLLNYFVNYHELVGGGLLKILEKVPQLQLRFHLLRDKLVLVFHVELLELFNVVPLHPELA